MAFVPTSTLGSVNANLGELVLGVIEEADVTVACSASASLHLAPGGLQARGSVICAAATSMVAHEGSQAYRLAAVRGPRYMKPPLGSVLSPVSSRGLLFACLMNERAGSRLRNLVDGVQGANGSGLQLAWNRNQFGDYVNANGAGPAGQGKIDWRAYPYGNAFTAACLFLNDQAGTGGFNTWLFASGSGDYGNSSTIDWGIGRHDGSTIAGIRTATSGFLNPFVTPISSSRPVMVVIVYDGATFSVYQDGQLSTSSAINEATVISSGSVTSMRMGPDAASTPAAYCAYMWNRALSLAEIQALTQDPYWAFVEKPRRVVTEKTATFAYQGDVECDAKATAAIAGQAERVGAFMANGKSTAAWTGTEVITSARFECDGKARSSWSGGQPLSGSFSAAGHGAADWRPSVIWTSDTLAASATATAAFAGKLQNNASLQCAAKSTANWQPAGLINASFGCDAAGTVYYLVGLDAVIVSCLTQGDKPTAVQHWPNFVY